MARIRRPWYRADRRMFYTTIDGKQYPLGVNEVTDEAGAWDALKTLISRLEGKAPPSQPPGKVCTVAEAIDAFLAHKGRTVKPVTLKNYSRHLAHFRDDFGPCQLRAVQIGSVPDRAKARGWSDTNTSNYLSTVEQCLRHAGCDVRLVKPGRESAGADTVIPELVYRACLRETTGDFHQLLRFLWTTGCRPSEATKAKVEHVDLSTGVIRLRDHKTRGKSGRPRLVFLGPDALAVVSEQIDRYKDGYLFRGLRNKPYSVHAIVHRFIRLSRKVGHPLYAYAFRHTFATRALKAGVPDTHVAALLGHANTVMVHRHYSHVTHDARLLRGVAEAIEKAG